MYLFAPIYICLQLSRVGHRKSVFRSDFVFPSGVALRWILAFLPMPFIVRVRVPLAVFCLFCRPF